MGNKFIKNIKSKNKKDKNEDKEKKEMPSNKLHNNTIDNQNKYIFNYYILFFGSSGTGTKTSLIKRIKEGKFIDVTGENKEIYEKIIYEKNDKKLCYI